jgi:hypothetical protein
MALIYLKSVPTIFCAGSYLDCTESENILPYIPYRKMLQTEAEDLKRSCLCHEPLSFMLYDNISEVRFELVKVGAALSLYRPHLLSIPPPHIKLNIHSSDRFGDPSKIQILASLSRRG